MSVCTGITDEPAIGLAFGRIYFGIRIDQELAVLVIINNVRCLAKLNSSGDGIGGIAADHSGQGATGNSGISGGSEDVAIDGAHGSIGQGEHDIAILDNNSVPALVGGNIQAQRRSLPVGQHHGALLEGNIGDNDLDGSLAGDLAAPDQLSSHFAGGTVGCKQAGIVDGAHGAVSQLPYGISRDLSSSTDHVSANSIELHSSAGGIELILGGDLSANKLTGSRCSRDYQDTVGGRTLAAVRGRAVQLQLFTGALGQEGRGTAAVTVDRLHTAQGEHKLSHFIAIEADGVGGLTAVIHDHDDGAVGLNTHEGTGSRIGGVILCILVHTVLDQEAEVCRNDLLFPTGDGRGSGADLGLGNVSGAYLAVLLVKVDDKAGLGTTSLALAVDILDAVHDQIAQRLAIQLGMLGIVSTVVPTQGQVHGGDHIAVAIGLCPGSLLGHDLHTVVLCRKSTCHALIAGNDLGILVMDVYLHNVSHLAVRTIIVIQNDLRLCNAGCQLIVVLGDDVVVAVTDRFVVVNCRKRRHGQQ